MCFLLSTHPGVITVLIGPHAVDTKSSYFIDVLNVFFLLLTLSAVITVLSFLPASGTAGKNQFWSVLYATDTTAVTHALSVLPVTITTSSNYFLLRTHPSVTTVLAVTHATSNHCFECFTFY